MYPKLTVNLSKIRENAQFIADACAVRGIRFSPVVKGVCADSRILSVLSSFNIHSMADSRLLNIHHMHNKLPKMLLRIADPDEAENIISLCAYSLQSELQTIQALDRAARKIEMPHRIILMIDLGDLREGLLYNEAAKIEQAAKTIHESPYLQLEGIGVNLTCFGGVLPDSGNLGTLVRIAKSLRESLNAPIPLISGGNSSSLGLMLSGKLPNGINHLRIGEGLLLGRDTTNGEPISGMHQDAFTLSAKLGEIQMKPSKPLGLSGLNAFGERVFFEDSGPMRRGIALVGRQDIDPGSLTARDARISILGASSDHLLLDLSRAPDIGLEPSVLFDVGYGSLLRAFTSPYVTKEYEEMIL